MENLILSVAAIAVIATIYININNKKQLIDSQISQTKKVLAYETNEHKINSTSYAKLNVKPSMLFITNNTHDKELLKKLAKAVEAELQSNPSAQSFSCSTLAQTKDITLKECKYIQSKHFTTILPSNQAVNTNAQNCLTEDANNSKQQQTLKIATAITVDKIAPTQITAVNTIKNINGQLIRTAQTQNKKTIDIVNPQNNVIFTKKIISLVKRGIVLRNIIACKKINKKNLIQALTLNQNHIKKIAYSRYFNYSKRKKTNNLDPFGFFENINMFTDSNKTDTTNTNYNYKSKRDSGKRNLYQMPTPMPQMPFKNNSNLFGFGGFGFGFGKQSNNKNKQQ